MSSYHAYNRLDTSPNHILEAAIHHFLMIRSRIHALLGMTGDFMSDYKTDTIIENTKVKLAEFYDDAMERLSEYFKSWLNTHKSHSNSTDAQKLKESIAEVRNSFKTLRIPRGPKYDNARIVSVQGTDLMEKTGKLSASLIIFAKSERACQSMEHIARVLSHAPRIGFAFACITPILVMGIKNGEVSDLVIKTFRRISALTDDLNTRIEKANKEMIRLSVDEIKEIRTLFKGIEDGIRAVVSVMEGRKLWSEHFLKLNVHEEQLKGWMATTDEMVDGQNRENISMMSYRTRLIMEKQKRYFRFLTFASFVNIGIVAAGLYFVFDIRQILMSDTPLI